MPKSLFARSRRRRVALPGEPIPLLRRRWLRGAICVAALAALAPNRSRAAPAVAAKPPRPLRLVVTIVVDQLSAWVLAERLPLLQPMASVEGGLWRMRREGSYVTDLRYTHAVTETAPGHAALYTGLPPRRSGIFANEVPPVAGCGVKPTIPLSARQSILLDPAHKLVSLSAPPPTGCGTSLRALRVDTLADRFRAAHPDAVIVSLSFKDRGALFGGGRHPSASLWYDTASGHFVTSTAFAPSLPGWIAETDRWLSALIDKGARWEPLDPAWIAEHAGTPDAQAGEGGDYGADAARGYPGIGVTFPHLVRSHKAVRASPFADEALFRAAGAALNAEGSSRQPILLALSFSANDSIGHVFGPDSWEAWDELRRFDLQLGAFMRDLDRRYGKDGYAIVLSADHGNIHMPEACASDRVDRWGRPCRGDGRRLLVEPTSRSAEEADKPGAPVDLVGLLQRAAVDVGGRPDWIVGIVDPYVHLSVEARGDGNRQKLLARLRDKPIPGLREIFDVADFSDECHGALDSTIRELVCRSIVPGSGGDLYLVPERGSFLDSSYSTGHGASHGTPYLYDRTVPLLARAPGRVAVRAIDQPLPFSTFTHTVAALLGIKPPDDDPDAVDLTAPPASLCR